MSLTRPVSEFEENPFGLSAAGSRCFFCGELLTDPAVQWHGFTGVMYLHAECVHALTKRLVRDALEIEYAGKPCWNQLNKAKASHG
jgi:hypothetical protein